MAPASNNIMVMFTFKALYTIYLLSVGVDLSNIYL